MEQKMLTIDVEVIFADGDVWTAKNTAMEKVEKFLKTTIENSHTGYVKYVKILGFKYE